MNSLFKVGDRVRISQGSEWERIAGKLATVTAVLDGPRVMFPYRLSVDAVGGDWCVSEIDLSLDKSIVNELPAPEVPSLDASIDAFSSICDSLRPLRREQRRLVLLAVATILEVRI